MFCTAPVFDCLHRDQDTAAKKPRKERKPRVKLVVKDIQVEIRKSARCVWGGGEGEGGGVWGLYVDDGAAGVVDRQQEGDRTPEHSFLFVTFKHCWAQPLVSSSI
jgi:ATP-dependent DNA ligase